MKPVLLLALVCGMALAVPPARSDDFWVDQAHPQASDSNDGSEAAPWLTIQHAADTAVAGDTVHVKPGTYPERVQLQTAGEPGARIVFRADPRRQATMHGFNTGWPWGQVFGHYVTIEGFNITNSDLFTDWDDVQGVFIQDTNHLEVLDNYFFEIKSYAVGGSGDSVRIANNEIYQVQMGIEAGGSNWVVEDNEVTRLYDYGGGDCDYSRFFGENHVFRRNFFHGTDFAEIGSAHVDCFQTFDNNGEHVLNILFEGNRCNDFHQGLMGEATFYHNSSRLTFQNNVFAHGGAWGLCVKDIAGVQAFHNTFVDIAYHGIGLSGGYASGDVMDNIFSGIETGYWASDGATIDGDYNLLDISQPPDTPAPHDIVGEDPLFVNAAESDYHLQKDSPAVDSAEPSGIPEDFDGVPRPQGDGWDMGAFEYVPVCSQGSDCTFPPECHTAAGATCVDEQCTYPTLPADTPCDDGDSCTQDDRCDANGNCIPGTSMCTEGGPPDGGDDDGGPDEPSTGDPGADRAADPGADRAADGGGGDGNVGGSCSCQSGALSGSAGPLLLAAMLIFTLRRRGFERRRKPTPKTKPFIAGVPI